MANNFDKFAILESFLDEVTSYLPEIEANLDALQQHPDDMKVIEETYRRTHTIGGSAAMMDFANLAHVAQGMEDTLGQSIDTQSALDAPTVALLRRSSSRLSRLVEYIRTETDGSALVSEDDADRAAWRGVGSGYLSAGPDFTRGPATPPGGLLASTNAGASSSPGMAIPDWLAPFAASGDSINVSGAVSGLHQPSQPMQLSPQPPMSPPAQSNPASATPPFAQSQPVWSGSGSNPGAFQPAASQPTLAQPASAPNLSDPWSASISDYPTNRGLSIPPTQSSTGSQATFDEMLNAFTAKPIEEQNTQNLAQTAPRIPAVPPMPPDAATPPWQQQPSQDVDFSMLGTNELPAVSTVPQPYVAGSYPQAAPANGTASFEELLISEESVHRQVAALRDVAASIYSAAKAMEDERIELRGFLDGSRDALARLEEWAGRQMGLDLGQSPDSVRRYLPLSVIWVTTMRLKNLISLLNNAGRGLTATQEQIEETLSDLNATIRGFGQLFTGGATPEAGFSATVAHFAWTPTTQPTLPESAVVSSELPKLTPGMRAELERDVREQLRRELEDDVRAEIASEVRRDEEDRLRQELQIQVRRQLLTDLAPTLTNDVQAQDSNAALAALSHLPMSARRAQPVQVTSEQSPEAMEVFREEAQEHLQTITAGIAQLEKAPNDMGALQNIRRAMHTLKGAAGMMGFAVIQQTAHASEDLLDRLVENSISFTPEVLSLLLDTSESLDYMATRVLNQPAEQQRALQPLASRYAAMTGIEIPDHVFSESGNAPIGADPIMIGLEDEREEGGEQPAADTTDLSVRLQLSKLDDLVNLFGDLLVNRSVLEERVDRLNRLVGESNEIGERLRDVSGKIETGFEAAALPSGSGSMVLPPNQDRNGRGGWSPVNGAQSSQGFHELELDRYTEFHQLTRNLNESVTDIVTMTHEMSTVLRECVASFARESRLSSDFQERLLKARLVPLQTLVPRLYRATRASALREGKEVEFFSDGTDTEVDRKVFEEVTGPLLHLVRNAVNHGIESPEAREMAGKPRAGKILVSANYEGNQVVIAVRDDGAGIDPEHIRNTAIARGWIDSYTQLSEKEAINLIFQPGITTAESLTEEAGRGVGLDVVRDAVTRLRGTIEVESAVGQGTVFTMKFPISLQIARAVLVKVKNQTLAIPMAMVDQIGRLDYYHTVSMPVPAVEAAGERYPLAHLASYLRIESSPVQERSPVLLVNVGNRRVALLVDGVVIQQEVVAKPLGPHLRDVRGVAGAAVLGNGQVVVILELNELLSQQPQDTIILPVKSASTASRPIDTLAETAPLQTPPASYPAARNGSKGNIAMPAAGAGNGPGISYPQYQQPTPQMPQAPAAGGSMPLAPQMPPMPPQQPTIQSAQPFVVANQPRTATSPHRVAVGPSTQFAPVLVVDDSPSVRRVVSNMLKAHGWEVQTARDGVEALEIVARQVPSAVLLDIEMPRMDGYELMATIRSQDQYRSLPLIVLTSRAASKHQQRAFQLGADAYLVKPYQDEELIGTLTRLIQGQGRS